MEADVLERDEVIDGSAKGVRTLVFVSHAAPEDNVFAKWLATQLAIAGYEVWCDVTKLLGGEKFWDDITEAIEKYACRVIFVSTLEGNSKEGTLRELKIAQNTQAKEALKDFIVPVKVDAFPYASMRDDISALNIIPFDKNWAAGLSQLLELFEREQIPRSDVTDAGLVADWYRRSLDERRKHFVSNDKHLSNWFPLELPESLQVFLYKGTWSELPNVAAELRFAHRIHGNYLITFASLEDSSAAFRDAFDENKTRRVNTISFIEEGDSGLGIEPFDASNIVTDLIRQAWDSAMEARELHPYALASGLRAWYFAQGKLEKDRAYYGPKVPRRSYRQLVGKKSKRTADGETVRDGFWHYAVSASPQLHPIPRVVLRHHVLFTDDGKAPWSSADRMHRARRRVCKQWWNAAWRDRLLAFCAQLGDVESVDDVGTAELRLPVGGQNIARVGLTAMSFTSPWSYYEDRDGGLDEAHEIILTEDESEDDLNEEDKDDKG